MACEIFPWKLKDNNTSGYALISRGSPKAAVFRITNTRDTPFRIGYSNSDINEATKQENAAPHGIFEKDHPGEVKPEGRFLFVLDKDGKSPTNENEFEGTIQVASGATLSRVYHWAFSVNKMQEYHQLVIGKSPRLYLVENDSIDEVGRGVALLVKADTGFGTARVLPGFFRFLSMDGDGGFIGKADVIDVESPPFRLQGTYRVLSEVVPTTECSLT
jgi:hypothetical protein